MTDVALAYVVTTCPRHGEKVTGDLASQKAHIGAVLDCAESRVLDRAAHDLDHALCLESCWVCCDQMTLGWIGQIG